MCRRHMLKLPCRRHAINARVPCMRHSPGNRKPGDSGGSSITGLYSLVSSPVNQRRLTTSHLERLSEPPAAAAAAANN